MTSNHQAKRSILRQSFDFTCSFFEAQARGMTSLVCQTDRSSSLSFYLQSRLRFRLRLNLSSLELVPLLMITTRLLFLRAMQRIGESSMCAINSLITRTDLSDAQTLIICTTRDTRRYENYYLQFANYTTAVWLILRQSREAFGSLGRSTAALCTSNSYSSKTLSIERTLPHHHHLIVTSELWRKHGSA